MNTPVHTSPSVKPTDIFIGEGIELSEEQKALQLSSIEELNVPEFEVSSEANAMMDQMGDISAKDKYLLSTLDLLRQKVDWMIPRIRYMSREVRKTNGTCIQLKNWQHSVEKDLDSAIAFYKEQSLNQEKDKCLKHFFKSLVVFLLGILGGLGGAFTLFTEFFSFALK